MQRCRWEGTPIEADADDLVQQAGAKALAGEIDWKRSKSATSDDEVDRAVGSLCATICNDVRNLRRRQQTRAKYASVLAKTNGADPEDRAVKEIDHSRAVAKLPAELRDAYVEICLQGRDAAGFAAERRRAEKTVRNDVARAKSILRRELGDHRQGERGVDQTTAL